MESESGGIYAAEKIIKKRYRKVNETDDKQSPTSTSISEAQLIEWVEYQIKYKITVARRQTQLWRELFMLLSWLFDGFSILYS